MAALLRHSSLASIVLSGTSYKKADFKGKTMVSHHTGAVCTFHLRENIEYKIPHEQTSSCSQGILFYIPHIRIVFSMADGLSSRQLMVLVYWIDGVLSMYSAFLAAYGKANSEQHDSADVEDVVRAEKRGNEPA